MAALSSNQQEILKNVYDKMVVDAQNLKPALLEKISKAAERPALGGKGFIISVNDYGNEAAKAINENEGFGTINQEHYANPSVIAKVMIAPFEFSGLAKAISEGDDMAFAQIAAQEMKRSRDRLRATENRMLYGYGKGTLATAAADISGQTVIVDSVQYLRLNMVVDVCATGAATEHASSVTISAINPTTKVVTFVGTVSSVVNTDELVLENCRASAASDGKEAMGLRGIIDDGTDLATFQGITVSSALYWQSVRNTASSASLTEDLLQQLCDDVNIRSGQEIDTLVMHPKQRRKALELALPQKRFADGILGLGHSKIEFNGMELFLDRDCQPTTVYGFPMKELLLFEIDAPKLGREDGSDIFLRTSGYDVFQAYWRHYANFGVRRRNALGKIVSLAEPSGAVIGS